MVRPQHSLSPICDGLAYAVCDMLDRDVNDNVFLAKRIKNLEIAGVLKA